VAGLARCQWPAGKNCSAKNELAQLVDALAARHFKAYWELQPEAEDRPAIEEFLAGLIS
jgi:hypothetical protein